MFGIMKLKRRILDLEAEYDALADMVERIANDHALEINALKQEHNKINQAEDEAFLKMQQAMQEGIMNIISYGGVTKGKRAD